MNRLTSLVVIFFLVAITSSAQDKKDIFDPKVKVTWLGLDVSSLKLIGDREKYGSMSDISHLIDAWNDLMMREKSKFNPAPSIGRREVELALEVAKEHNQSVDIAEIYTEDKSQYLRLKEADVERTVSEYDFKGKTGLGLLFVGESFSKLNNESAVWVTFVDMGSGKVLLTERMHGEPGGAGVRNLWANSLFNIMEKLKREFPKWKKRYIG